MDLETFAKLYYIASDDIKILVISFLKEAQPQNEPPVKHSDTVCKDE